MANKQEIIDTQQHLQLEQEQLVGYWIKKFGINKKDLDTHPAIDDVIFLLKFKNEFQDMNNFRQKQFNRIWNYCYKGKFLLKAKHLKQLQAGAEHTIRKRNRLNQQQQAIKARRQNPQKLCQLLG